MKTFRRALLCFPSISPHRDVGPKCRNRLTWIAGDRTDLVRRDPILDHPEDDRVIPGALLQFLGRFHKGLLNRSSK